jgi:hypothetical protein
MRSTQLSRSIHFNRRRVSYIEIDEIFKEIEKDFRKLYLFVVEKYKKKISNICAKICVDFSFKGCARILPISI